MSIEIKEKNFENYGNCVHITNGIIEVIVTIDVGPRIVRFGFVGGENMLYNDLQRSYVTDGRDYEDIFGAGNKFYRYGGHRLWLSPMSMPDTFYPDNEPVVYGILPDGVSFTPARQKNNNMQLGFEVMMNEDATDIMIVHSAKNQSKDTKTLALWAVTMLIPGGLQIIPQNHSDDDLVPNRVFVLWPNTNITDPRAFWGEKYITLQQDEAYDKPFEFGMDNLQGWAAYVNHDVALVKRYVHNMQAAYPDYGASYETYMNKDFVEMESLSPLYEIEPGDTVRHVENLTLFKIKNAPNPRDDEQLEKFITNMN
ncbi:MAG TPA: hypothetical protein VHO94_01170 [Oscillospiraceae bacterium]|nr:hypothetical protein [Oscillospiraceae bacterium]